MNIKNVPRLSLFPLTAEVNHQGHLCVGGCDVVSGGELTIAHSVGFPLAEIYFHGNNKTPEELKLALNWDIGRVVVDNFYELELLDESGYGQKEVFWQVAQAISEVLPHGNKEKQLLQGFLYGKQSYVKEQALGQQVQLF